MVGRSPPSRELDRMTWGRRRIQEKEKGRLLAPSLQSRIENGSRAFSRLSGQSWPREVPLISIGVCTNAAA